MKNVTDFEAFPSIVDRKRDQHDLDCISSIRFRLIDLRYGPVGKEWNSCGKARTDVLHHLNFVLGGKGEVWNPKTRLAFRPGYAYWLPANTPLQARCDKPLDLYFLRFRCEWMTGLDLFWDWHHPVCLGEWQPECFLPDWKSGRLEAESIWQLQAYLHGAFARCLLNHSDYLQRQIALHSTFADVFRVIEAGTTAKLRIADLASKQGVTLNAFTRLFRRNFGLTPKAYLNRRLNQEACDLLLSTDLPVSVIARQLEFTDEYYFFRFFMKMNHVTPRMYRKYTQMLR